MEFSYTANGEKLKSVYSTLVGGVWQENYTHYYLSGLEIRNDEIEALNHPDGRIVKTAAPLAPASFAYQYRIADHLGNTRVLFDGGDHTGTLTANDILQENHYYPFGLEQQGSWQASAVPENRYRYNGKELNEEIGHYFYGFRMYDPAIGRFTGVDPISDKFPHVSVYNYAENEPIAHIDLWGLQKYRLRPGETPSTVNSRNAFDYAAKAALLSDLVDNSRRGEAVDVSPDMRNGVSRENNYGVPGGILDLNLHGSESGKLLVKNGDDYTEISDEDIESYIDDTPDATAIVFSVCNGARCNLERFADYAGVPVVTTGNTPVTADENGQDVGSDSYTRYDPVGENGQRRTVTLNRSDYGTEAWSTILQSLGIRNEQKDPE